MNELKLTLYERDGVPDNARWEASTGIHHALGATPGEAVERLVSRIDAARAEVVDQKNNMRNNGLAENGRPKPAETASSSTLPFASMDKIGKVES